MGGIGPLLRGTMVGFTREQNAPDWKAKLGQGIINRLGACSPFCANVLFGGPRLPTDPFPHSVCKTGQKMLRMGNFPHTAHKMGRCKLGIFLAVGPTYLMHLGLVQYGDKSPFCRCTNGDFPHVAADKCSLGSSPFCSSAIWGSPYCPTA